MDKHFFVTPCSPLLNSISNCVKFLLSSLVATNASDNSPIACTPCICWARGPGYTALARSDQHSNSFPQVHCCAYLITLKTIGTKTQKLRQIFQILRISTSGGVSSGRVCFQQGYPFFLQFNNKVVIGTKF